MNHIKMFEDFQEGPLKKSPNLFQRAIKGTRNFLGMENTEDRETLNNLYRIIYKSPEYVSNIRVIKPGVIVAWILSNSLSVDSTEQPEILYKGKSLDLQNTKEEAEELYNLLSNI